MDWLDVGAVCRTYAVSRSTVWRWFGLGLQRERVGKRWKTRQAWLAEFFLDDERMDAAAEAAEAEQRALEERLGGGRRPEGMSL